MVILRHPGNAKGRRRLRNHDSDELLGPELYGTGLETFEGLWHRSGWIGEH
jgi:hypothetical protein